MYRVATTESTWLILENGQFYNSSDFNSNTPFWVYENGLLVGSTHSADERSKKLPVLSCEFTVGEEVISMDDFLEEFRFVGDVPPLAVIMAAFMIQQRNTYAWWNATFNAFLRSGDPVSFGGGSKMFQTSSVVDLSGNRPPENLSQENRSE
jgi:hypothetical protein